MSSRWDSRDYWPEVEYARRPAEPKVDWSIVAVYLAPIVVWTIILALIWWGFA